MFCKKLQKQHDKKAGVDLKVDTSQNILKNKKIL